MPRLARQRGPRSEGASLTFAETAEVLETFAKYADVLMNPKTAQEAFREIND